MLKQKARAIALGVLLTDLALTAVSFPLSWALRHGFLTEALPSLFPLPLFPLNQYLLLLFFILPIWGLLLSAAGFYRSHRTLPLGEEIWAAGKVSFGGTAILVLLIYGLRLDFVSRWFLVLFGVINFLFLATEKTALRLTSRWVRARGFNFRTALLVGTGAKAEQLADFLEGHPHWGFRVVGYVDDNGGDSRLQRRWPCMYLMEALGIRRLGPCSRLTLRQPLSYHSIQPRISSPSVRMTTIGVLAAICLR